MTSIVGVHGIGKYHYYEEAGGSADRAAEAVRAKWNGYLHQGLTGEGLTDAGLTGEYVAEVAYYAHHLRTGPPGQARQARQMETPAKLVLAGWAAQLGGPFRELAGESLTGLAHLVAEWLLERLGPQAARFARDFCPEVAAYLGGGPPRARAREAVAGAIRRHRPRVVVAHSLGSVVAYEALWAFPDLRADLLVTLGSPLGMRGVVFERLAPVPVLGRGARPPGVRRWVNIADEDDIAAIPAALASCFDGVERDVSCDIDWLDFHSVRNYLRCGSANEFLRPYVT